MMTQSWKILFYASQVLLASTRIDRNVYGSQLKLCCKSSKSGMFQNGFCTTDADENEVKQIVCANFTEAFLNFLSTSQSDSLYHFTTHENLGPGDCWCLCAMQWVMALKYGVAPPVNLQATHYSILNHVGLADLLPYDKTSEQKNCK